MGERASDKFRQEANDGFCHGDDSGDDDVAPKPSVIDDATASVRINSITCAEMEATFDRVEFVLSSVRTLNNKSTRLLVNSSRFIDDVTDVMSQYHGGLHLTFSAMSATIQLVDTNFTRQVGTATEQSDQ